MTLAQMLMLASAAVAFAMGAGHLWLTFFTRAFHPRDPETEARMRRDCPQLTGRTTMWDTWIGFNGSHSLAPMLYGATYGYLAWAHPSILFGSVVLRALGLATLLGLLALGLRYWFNMLVRGLLVVIACYVGALVAA